jgi:hypothetical protein
MVFAVDGRAESGPRCAKDLAEEAGQFRVLSRLFHHVEGVHQALGDGVVDVPRTVGIFL